MTDISSTAENRGSRGIFHRESFFFFSVVLAYAAVTIFGLAHHEPWRDEAEIWLYARDLSLTDLLYNVAHIAGTPALWYLINYGLFHLGFPYLSEFIAHWCIALAAVAVFVRFAPFSRLTKILFAFSYFMIWEYAIVARHYGLTVLFLFLILTIYRTRFDRPVRFSLLLFLLFNTTTHSFMAAFFLGAVYVAETWRREKTWGHYLAYAMLLLAIVTFAAQVAPARHAPIRSMMTAANPTSLVETLQHTLKSALFPYALGKMPLAAVKLAVPSAVVVVLYVLVLLTLAGNGVALAFVLSTHAWLLYLFRWVNIGSVRHHGLLVVFFLAGIWLATHYRGTTKAAAHLPFRGTAVPKAIVSCLLALTLLGAAFIYVDEYRYSFSGSREAAEFLLKNNLEGHTVVAYPPWTACAVLPYLPGKKFWYADREEYGSYLKQDARYFRDNYTPGPGGLRIRISNDEVVEKARKQFGQEQRLLLLLGRPLPGRFSGLYELIFSTRAPIFYARDEMYFIYRKRSW